MDKDIRKKIRQVAGGAKSRARNKGLECEDDLFALALGLYDAQGGRCAITGLPFNLRVVGSGAARRPFAPSLDRIDSDSGYTRDNTRLVCQVVNFALNSYGEDVFLEIAIAATEFDPTDLGPLSSSQAQSLTGEPIVPNEDPERKKRYIEHIISEAPKILRAYGGPVEKSTVREALRRSFRGELPLDEANAYGWGFRRLTEAGVIQPASKSDFYSLTEGNSY